VHQNETVGYRDAMRARVYTGIAVSLLFGVGTACGSSSSGTDSGAPDATQDDSATHDSSPTDGGLPSDAAVSLTLGGSFDASGLQFLDSLGYVTPALADSGAPTVFHAVFENKTNLCVAGIPNRENATLLAISIDSATATLAVGPTCPGCAYIAVETLSSGCIADASASYGETATVTIATSTSTEFSGNFSVAFPTAGTLTGTFEVPYCAQSFTGGCIP
jgi:hypothetical protein